MEAVSLFFLSVRDICSRYKLNSVLSRPMQPPATRCNKEEGGGGLIVVRAFVLLALQQSPGIRSYKWGLTVPLRVNKSGFFF